MKKKIMSMMMSSFIFASMAASTVNAAVPAEPMDIPEEVTEKWEAEFSYNDIFKMTKEGNISDVFKEKKIEASKIWTSESVADSLEKGRFPVLILKPDNIFSSYDVFNDDGQFTVYEADLGKISGYYGVPETLFTVKGKTLESNDGIYERYYECIITPISRCYNKYTDRVAAVLNYMQQSPDFDRFCEEDMSVDFLDGLPVSQGIINLLYNLPNEKYVRGDVNNDGDFDIADLLTAQKWMINSVDVLLGNWEVGDFNDDESFDVFDLILMRKALIEKSE
ncbi:MAG: dockerin type I repeat-containing protein [Ruminococcus sp.]|uniref:dockerin type I repeat-containing protein n=1 Tax=Ruminococcus sp. TaxID=41978 RepID=UPI0025FD358B|nr:dockerin type I repeat-containing protein [Ruminococcus sp.]MCR4794770.1 dockerin type I repeat-containing protein [Ruminococcus sp.]